MDGASTKVIEDFDRAVNVEKAARIHAISAALRFGQELL
jgi:hypothetical protein